MHLSIINIIYYPVLLEFLAEAIYLSVDPYMRAYAPTLKLGEVFIGVQVAK